MDLITKERIVAECYNVCLEVQANPTDVPDWYYLALLLGTCSVETGFNRGTSKRPSGGIGPWNVNIDDAVSIYGDFDDAFWKQSVRDMFRRRQKRVLWSIFSKSWIGISDVPYFEIRKKDLRYLLVHNPRFGAAMVRWYYLNSPVETPETLSGVAEYWASEYQTSGGAKKEPAEFLDAWIHNDCPRLMRSLGYA